jgi:hypothetical protein
MNFRAEENWKTGRAPHLEEYCLLFTTLLAQKGSAEKESHQ